MDEKEENNNNDGKNALTDTYEKLPAVPLSNIKEYSTLQQEDVSPPKPLPQQEQIVIKQDLQQQQHQEQQQYQQEQEQHQKYLSQHQKLIQAQQEYYHHNGTSGLEE